MKDVFIGITLLVTFLFGCQQKVNQCKDIYAGEKFAGTGYLFYFGTSQDSMGDFWFFPSCDSERKSSSFSNIEYKEGVSFKLPLTGTIYKELSSKFLHEALDDKSFAKNAWYVPVYIEISNIKKSIIHSQDTNNHWRITLSQKSKTLTFSYFIADELYVDKLEVK